MCISLQYGLTSDSSWMSQCIAVIINNTVIYGPSQNYFGFTWNFGKKEKKWIAGLGEFGIAIFKYTHLCAATLNMLE